MGVLSDDLRNLGYSRTEKESPFDDDGELWTKGYELVCDETGIVIRKDGNSFQSDDDDERKVYRYRNSERVKLIGGFLGTFEWGETEDGFRY